MKREVEKKGRLANHLPSIECNVGTPATAELSKVEHIAACTLHSRHLSKSVYRRLDTTKAMCCSGADSIVVMQLSLTIANIGAGMVAVPRACMSVQRCC